MEKRTYHPADLLSHGSLREIMEEARAAMEADAGLSTLEAMAVVIDAVHEDGVEECAINYIDTLEMERCKGEQPVYKLVPMPTKTLTSGTVVSLPDVDGMSMEALFHNHVAAMRFLEELSKEV
jgi:hypothetical protein